MGIQAFVQANAFLRSDKFVGLYPANIANPTQQEGYLVVNGTAGLSFLDRKVTVAAYARNLFDQSFVTSIFDLPFGGAGDRFVMRDAQRTVGIQLGLRF